MTGPRPFGSGAWSFALAAALVLARLGGSFEGGAGAESASAGERARGVAAESACSEVLGAGAALGPGAAPAGARPLERGTSPSTRKSQMSSHRAPPRVCGRHLETEALENEEHKRRTRSRRKAGRERPDEDPAPAVDTAAARFELVLDERRMLALFQVELPRLAREPLRITACKAKGIRSRAELRAGRLRVVYTLRARVGEEERELVLLGRAPDSASFLEEEPCRALRESALVAPFRVAGLHVPGLELALRFYPLDPRLPTLAEIEGGAVDGLLARHLFGESGARAGSLERELRHYKPFKRAVLRVRGARADEPAPRALYAKLFADERGAGIFRLQAALFEATRGARALRMPRPLAYDPARRMLLLSEAAGPPTLSEWIAGLESGSGLPRGVGLARVERCLAVVAEALAELQASGVKPRARRGYCRQLAAMAKDRRLVRGEIARAHPELARRAEHLLARLQGLIPGVEELVAAHGAFRHKQMLGDEHSLTVIDWDGLCSADPALDAASFLLRLRQEPMLRPGAAPELAALAAGFRREFLARVPRVSAQRLALYEGLTATEALLRSFRRVAKAGVVEAEALALAAAAGEALDRAQPERSA